jgi:hypothetical protein
MECLAILFVAMSERLSSLLICLLYIDLIVLFLACQDAAGKLNSATSDTGVLANFFNSLLSKKTAVPVTGGVGGDMKSAGKRRR